MGRGVTTTIAATDTTESANTTSATADIAPLLLPVLKVAGGRVKYTNSSRVSQTADKPHSLMSPCGDCSVTSAGVQPPSLAIRGLMWLIYTAVSLIS